MARDSVAHVVEEVELGLSTNEAPIGDAGLNAGSACGCSDAGRGSACPVEGPDVVDDESLAITERIYEVERPGRAHVGLVDGGETAHRGAVEHVRLLWTKRRPGIVTGIVKC